MKKYNVHDFSDLEFEGVNTHDAMDFVDTFIIRASYKGDIANDDQLDWLNDNFAYVYREFINLMF